MSDTTDQVLEQAYALIEEDRLADAQALLEPILAAEPDNADAWWLYAHAVSDPEKARNALNTVLRLDPQYPGAPELMQTLEAEYPVSTEGMRRITPPPTLPSMPEERADDFEDDFADFESEFELEEDLEPEVPAEDLPKVPPAERRSPWMVVVVGLVAVAAVILVLLSALSRDDDQQVVNQNATETAVAQQQVAPPTLDMTLDTSAVGEAPPTIPVSGNTEIAIASALADFAIVEQSIGATETLMGNTLLVSVCSSANGQERAEALNDMMYAIADTVSLVDSDIEAVGVRLVDCADDRVFNVIAAPITQATSFSEGDIDARTYQASWQPVL